MPLGPGVRPGPYEIRSALGAGGMGDLPDAFARDPERVARFEREAKTLASPNHQQIALIHY
jgi:hypothetical protein